MRAEGFCWLKPRHNCGRVRIILTGLILFLPSLCGAAEAGYCPPPKADAPQVSSPPEEYSSFYKKYIDAGGIAILSPDKVCDRSLQLAYLIVSHMLEKRPDIWKRLSDAKARAVVCAIGQKQTDLPEFKQWAEKYSDAEHTRTYNGACGATGFKDNPVSATSEANIIGDLDPVKGRSIFIHEFGHLIHNVGLDQNTRDEITQLFKEAQAAHLFLPNKGLPPSYAMRNEMEFFAMATMTWFSAAYWRAPFNSIHERNRETQASHDPDLDRVLSEIYPADDWQFPTR